MKDPLYQKRIPSNYRQDLRTFESSLCTADSLGIQT